MYVAFRIWNSYEPRDRNAACDRFMDKISSLTDVFHNEAMSFDRETGTASPKEFTDWLYQQSNVIVVLTEY